jgi:hypothetical protein
VASFVVRREAGDVTIGPALAFGQQLGGAATRGDSAGRLRVVSGSRAARCGVLAVARTAAVSVVLESPTTLVRLE